MGCHQYTASVPTSTQHQSQQGHGISTNKYTASIPRRRCFWKSMGYHQSVHSMSTNQHTASLPAITQHQKQRLHSFNTKRICVWMKTHGLPSVHSCSMSTNRHTASSPASTQHQNQQDTAYYYYIVLMLIIITKLKLKVQASCDFSFRFSVGDVIIITLY